MKLKIKILLPLLTLTLLCSGMTSCSTSNKKASDSAAPKTQKESKVDSLKIKYVGNSCFYIAFPDGTRLVSDPYGSSYASSFAPFPSLEADVMTISHTHEDHTSGINEVKGNPKVINPEDIDKTFKVGSVEITGYKTEHVASMGDNTVFVMKFGDFKIVNMGETDNMDSPQLIEKIKDADVVLAYAGEYGTIKNKATFEFLNKINAKVIIPEHYSMSSDNIFYNEPTIDQIIKELPEGTTVSKLDDLTVSKDMKKQFVVLSAMGNKK